MNRRHANQLLHGDESPKLAVSTLTKNLQRLEARQENRQTRQNRKLISGNSANKKVVVQLKLIAAHIDCSNHLSITPFR